MWWMLWACGDGAVTCDGAACLDADAADLDGDGVPAGLDCDDSDPLLNDADHDGDGFTTCDGDCADDPATDANAALRGPRGAVREACDNVDNDCNFVTDEGDQGVSACLVEMDVVPGRHTRLDLVVVYDTETSFNATAQIPLLGFPTLLAQLAGTDTRLAVLPTTGLDGLLVGVEGARWVSMLDASGPDATTFVERALGGLYTYGQPNHTLSQLLLAEATRQNQGFFRDGVDRVALVLTGSDDASLPPNQFQQLYHGRVYLLGPDPAVGCGGAAAPRLQQVAVAHVPNCSPSVFDFLDTFALDEAPAYDIVVPLHRQEILPVTRQAELLLADGTRLSLEAEDLPYDPLENVITVADFRWPDAQSMHLTFQRVPEALQQEEPSAGQ